jgi:hypothetical protein
MIRIGGSVTVRRVVAVWMLVGAVFAACGGRSNGTAGAQSGVGGASGGTGVATLVPGAPAECPKAMPVYEFDCQPTLPDRGCTYQVSCQTGAQLVTMSCGGKFWRAESPLPCQRGDFCTVGSYQLQCLGSGWQVGGAGEAGFCPAERVANGSACFRGPLDSTPPCGYFCADGSWTVGFCGFSMTSEQQYLFTPPCPGEELPLAGAGGAAGATGEGGSGGG